MYIRIKETCFQMQTIKSRELRMAGLVNEAETRALMNIQTVSECWEILLNYVKTCYICICCETLFKLWKVCYMCFYCLCQGCKKCYFRLCYISLCKDVLHLFTLSA